MKKDIFYFADTLSRTNYLMAEIAGVESGIKELKEEICRNCEYWLTDFCDPETTHKTIRTANSPGCRKYEQSGRVDKLIEDASFRMSRLKNELNGLKSGFKDSSQ